MNRTVKNIIVDESHVRTQVTLADDFAGDARMRLFGLYRTLADSPTLTDCLDATPTSVSFSFDGERWVITSSATRRNA